MKLKFMLCIALIWACTNDIKAQACCAGGGGSCCSSAGGGCSSILPDYDKHIVGVHYSYGSYSSTTYPMSTMTMSDGMDMSSMGPGEATKGSVNMVDVYGRFNLPKRFQIAVDLPVMFLKESYPGTTTRTSGLGDASVMIQYSIFCPKAFASKRSKHQLRIGAGVKAPTGKFNMSDGMISDLQLGTGSVDFLFSTIYTYRFKSFGFNLSASYRKNLDNKEHYQFGDKVSGGANLFYMLSLPKGFTLMPKVGSGYNHTFCNIYNGETLTYTGGDVLKVNAGFDIYYKHFILSTSVAPVVMTITNWSGEAIPLYSLETGIYYSF